MKDMNPRLLALALAVIAGCDHSPDPDPTLAAGSGSAKQKGSAGGFSASLTADLAQLDGGPVAASTDAAVVALVPAMDGGAAIAASPDAAAVAALVPDAGSAKPVAMVPSIDAGSTAVAPADGSAPPPPKVHAVVKISADLAAIKLSLLPNWVRDLDEAGSYSLVVHIDSKPDMLFTFHYGYDDPAAPTDHDAYMKYLAEKKILGGSGPGGIVGLNRQRGAAWYLEGVEPAGGPAFRYLVLYGGKHLICYGSLYKESNLGDLRDEVIIQAKKICESITL